MKVSLSRLCVGSVGLVLLLGSGGCAKKTEKEEAKELRDEVLAGRIAMIDVAIEIVPPEAVMSEPAIQPHLPAIPPPVPEGGAAEKPRAPQAFRPAPREAKPAPVILFGTGTGIWDRKEQFNLTPDQVRDILKSLPAEAFKKPSIKAPAPDSSTVESGVAVPAIGRVDGPERKGGAILPRPAPRIQAGHVRVIIRGTTTGMEFKETPAPIAAALKLAMAAVSEKSISTESLADALKKLDKKELAIETLQVSIPAVPMPRNAGSQKVKEGEAPTRSLYLTGLGLEGVSDGVPLPVARKALQDALRVLIDNDAGTLPQGLVTADKIGSFGVRVLNQHRHFDLQDIPEIPAERRVQATPEQLRRVERIHAGLQKVGRDFLEQCPNLPPEPPAQVSPGNPGVAPAQAVPEQAP